MEGVLTARTVGTHMDVGADSGGDRTTPGKRAALLAVVVVLGSLAGCFGGTPGESTELGAATETPTDSAAPDDDTLSVHFVHVGQGASVLVVGPSGETLLYDTGNWRDDGRHVLDYLDARNVTRIDYLVTSHADADHVGGHAAVVDHYETDEEGVGAIYDPGIAAATRTYEAYLDAVERHDVTLYRARAGDEIPMAGVSVRALAPPEGYLAERDRNENTLVLRVGYGNASVLLPGDAGGAGERYLTDAYAAGLNATVLAAGHHGSNTSTGPALLAATSPRVAVVQSAADSPYGHPHREVLARLADRGIPTYWTGVHGDVVLETDGEQVAVRTRHDAPTDPLDLRDAPGVQPGSDGRLERRASFAVGASAVAADGGRATVPTSSADPASALVLDEINADAAGDDRENLTGEYLVFRNAGDRMLDLSGWTVGDEADHSYRFPDGTTLAPGETLTLYTGSGRDRAGEVYWNASQPVWNNAGDTVFVRTAEGELVVEVTYDG